jgi:Glucose / Sorbosone dehydrogenase
MLRWIVAIAVSLSVSAAGCARAASLESIGNFDQPIFVTSDPGNVERLFVVEREGEIMLVEGGARSVFANLSSLVSCCEGERGLLSIALAPDFDTSGRFYVDYTGKEEPGEIHVDELVATGPNHEGAGLGSLRSLLSISHSADNHNGGQLQLGPEGDLFVSVGDNGNGENAHKLENGLGKILRIGTSPSGSLPYTVPPGNPLIGKAGDYEPIWSYGLRNPFRFSFDGGAMVIGDVGENAREEVDYAPAVGGTVGGREADYGWNCMEGSIAGPGALDSQCEGLDASRFVNPVFDYEHTPDPNAGGPDRCAIIGGYVVRDAGLGALDGHYLYTDYCSGAIRALQLPATASGSASGDCWTGLRVSNPVSFGEDAAGRLYVVSEEGPVYRIVGPAPANCPAPPPTAAPSPTGTPFLYVGIHAQRRHVRRGKTAVLTVWVSPCAGRKGKPVRLLRNGHRNGSKYLSRACTARFLRRVHRNTVFRATLENPNDGADLAASRKLKIRIAHRHRRR